MTKEPTKAELLAQIASLEDQNREGPEDALIRAIASVVATDHALDIKHLFYRRNVDGEVQISLDMHEGER